MKRKWTQTKGDCRPDRSEARVLDSGRWLRNAVPLLNSYYKSNDFQHPAVQRPPAGGPAFAGRTAAAGFPDPGLWLRNAPPRSNAYYKSNDFRYPAVQRSPAGSPDVAGRMSWVGSISDTLPIHYLFHFLFHYLIIFCDVFHISNNFLFCSSKTFAASLWIFVQNNSTCENNFVI